MRTIILNIEKVGKFPKFLWGFLILKLALLRLYYFLRKYPLFSNTRQIWNCLLCCCQRLWALRENQQGKKLGRYLRGQNKKKKVEDCVHKCVHVCAYINNKHGETQYLGLKNLYRLGLIEKVCGNINILGFIIRNMSIARHFLVSKHELILEKQKIRLETFVMVLFHLTVFLPSKLRI